MLRQPTKQLYLKERLLQPQQSLPIRLIMPKHQIMDAQIRPGLL